MVILSKIILLISIITPSCASNLQGLDEVESNIEKINANLICNAKDWVIDFEKCLSYQGRLSEDIYTATGEMLNPTKYGAFCMGKGYLEPHLLNFYVASTGMLLSWSNSAISPYTAPFISLGYSLSNMGIVWSILKGTDYYSPKEKIVTASIMALSWATTIPIALFPDFAGPLTMSFFAGASLINIFQQYHILG